MTCFVYIDKAVFYDIVKKIITSRKESSETSEELPFIDALLSAQLPESITEADVVSYLIGGVHTSGYCENAYSDELNFAC